MNNFIKQHKYLIILFILFSIIAIFSWFKITNDQFSTSPANGIPSSQRDNKFSSINFQNSNEQTATTSLNHNNTISSTQQNNTTTSPQVTRYTLQVTSTSTAYDAMKNSELNFKTKTFSGLGEFVEEINGLKNDAQVGKYWIYYLNGESARLGISQQIVKPNDIITWNYETTNF